MEVLDNIVIMEGEDTFTWLLEKSGQYTTKSMYRIGGYLLGGY